MKDRLTRTARTQSELHLGSRQRGDVHDGVGLEVSLREHHAVRQHQPALGVRVVDLHRAARVQLVDVVRPGGLLVFSQ